MRLIEEAQCLSEVTMEPTYTTIQEPITTMIEGSETVISDIPATRDPRALICQKQVREDPLHWK